MSGSGFHGDPSLESSLNQKSCFSLLNLSNSSAAREWTASQTNQEGRDENKQAYWFTARTPPAVSNCGKLLAVFSRGWEGHFLFLEFASTSSVFARIFSSMGLQRLSLRAAVVFHGTANCASGVRFRQWTKQ